ncbi:hypothetical protein [Actinomadura miaoliensis]|uniref:Peptidase n=1 Tax=Actinomadura miaoliensis TaxID=430685 RepID=A0ABP7WU00_9ACTN
MNDEREPRPVDGNWAQNPWIIIDDTADAAEEPAPAGADEPPVAPRGGAGPGGASTDAADGRPSSVGPAQSNGWESSGTSQTWNGMNMAPPGAEPRTTIAFEAAPGAGGGGQSGAGQSGAAAAWEAPSGDAVQAPPTGGAQTAWYTDDLANEGYASRPVLDDRPAHDDDAPRRPARRALVNRLPRPGGIALGPALVTFVITCLSVLLVVSSIIWRPHTP